jgi:hypothetical protein
MYGWDIYGFYNTYKLWISNSFLQKNVIETEGYIYKYACKN